MKHKKQFGVWMDSHHAVIVGRDDSDNADFKVLGQVDNKGADNNSSENASNNHEVTMTHKFFKAIADKMPNIEEIHITGTGQVQEQFKKFLAETPQYKTAKSTESTSIKMSDEQLTAYIVKHFG